MAAVRASGRAVSSARSMTAVPSSVGPAPDNDARFRDVGLPAMQVTPRSAGGAEPIADWVHCHVASVRSSREQCGSQPAGCHDRSRRLGQRIEARGDRTPTPARRRTPRAAALRGERAGRDALGATHAYRARALARQGAANPRRTGSGVTRRLPPASCDQARLLRSTSR
jgi:hypothetical protein